MSPETDLFGRPPAAPARYAPDTRGPLRPWSPQEDLCLLPVLFACESDRAYLEACRFLCRTLDRVPRLPGRPSGADLTRECVALVERRTVTGTLTGAPAVAAMARWLFGGLRTGPFTWAEVERFVRPWHGKSAQGRIALPTLQILLERRESFRPELERLVAGARLAQHPESHNTGHPARPDHAPALAVAVNAFRSAPADDEHALTTAWANLHTVATT